MVLGGGVEVCFYAPDGGKLETLTGDQEALQQAVAQRAAAAQAALIRALDAQARVAEPAPCNRAERRAQARAKRSKS